MSELFSLLPAGTKGACAGILCASLIGAVLGTASVASIMPFMAVLADPSAIEQQPALRYAYVLSSSASPEQFLFVLGIAVLGLMASSNLWAALVHWRSARFAADTSAALSRRLFSRYVHERYPFFLTRNTSVLSKNVLGEAANVVNGLLIPAISLAQQSILAICVMSFLLTVDLTLGVLVGLGLAGAYAAVYQAVRRRQTRLGQARVEANGIRFRVAAETFGGIKELKILGREAPAIARFDGAAVRLARATAAATTVAAFPKLAMEVAAFGGMLVILFYQLRVKGNWESMLPVASLYVFAGYRLIPAFQSIFTQLLNMRYNAPALAEVLADFSYVVHGSSSQVEGESQPVAFERELRVEDVVFAYSEGREHALRGVSLEIRSKTTVAVVGATGSGKSTLLDILLGLLEPQSGRLLLDGQPLTPDRYRAWQRKIGYVPQHIFLSDDTVTGNIAFGLPSATIDRAQVERAARLANIHDFVITLPEAYDTVVGERGVRLSGGQRQRIAIARALYHDPDILLFDEATSALDGATEEAVMAALSTLSRSKTLVLVAHRLSTVRNADRIYCLDRGQVIASGTYDELLESSQEFRSMALAGAR